MQIKITPEDVRNFIFEGDDNFTLIEEGDWTQDYKYQLATYIYKENATGKHYAFEMSRSGSYHSDWYYSWEDLKTLELDEVVSEEVKTTVWKKL